jgi:flagellin
MAYRAANGGEFAKTDDDRAIKNLTQSAIAGFDMHIFSATRARNLPVIFYILPFGRVPEFAMACGSGRPSICGILDMALTITNTNTLALLNILNKNLAAQANTFKQLTTGKRINSGKDDPAGLIALQNLNAELTAVNASLTNNQRSDSMLTIADSAIEEISNLLGEIETLVAASTSSANLTAAEISANQSQIDDALSAIDRIVKTTNFNGKKLLDGSFGIQTSNVAGNQYIENVRVFSRSQSTSDTALTVSRVASAQLASATFAFAGGSARTSGTTQVAITGTLGTAIVTLTSGLTLAQIVSTINAAKDQTGVSAIQRSTSVKLNSTTYGSDSFVSVEVLSGGKINATYGTSTGDGNTTNDIHSVSKQSGVDANITINGQAAGVDGLNVSYSANGLSLAFTLDSNFGKGNTGATRSTSFTVKAQGGATFQLGTTAETRSTIGIDSLATYNLGGGNGTARLSELKSGAAKALKTDVAGALTAVREAIKEVADVRGRIGGFQKFQVGSAINALQAAQTGLGEATSLIGDTDFAIATARLNQQQVLINAGISLLGVANQQAAAILSLL